MLTCAQSAWASLLVKPKFGADADPTAVAEIIATVNEVAREYPAVRGATLTNEGMPFGVYAYAAKGKIAFNSAYIAKPHRIQQMMNTDVLFGFHPPLGRCTGPQFLAYHESAHLIDRDRYKAPRLALLVKFGDGHDLHKTLSGYSFGRRGLFNPGEALAEAFASVKCNGGNAVERAMYDTLTA